MAMWRRGRSSARSSGILARNLMFLGGGRRPTPEEVDERDDVLRR
jgi:hypothetical protein